MFDYKMLYKIKNSEVETNIRKDDSYCLLIPELILDVANKIGKSSIKIDMSSFVENGRFNNGYCILCKERYIKRIIRDDGTSIDDLPRNTRFLSPRFWNDRLLVKIEENYAYIDGVSGKIYTLPEEYSDALVTDYFDGYALATKGDKKFYLDKELKKAHDKDFLEASFFANEMALVCTDKEWQIIDSNFKPLFTFSRNESRDGFFKELVDKINRQAFNEAKRDSLVITEKGSWPNQIVILDKNTNISILAPKIMKNIAEKLGLELPLNLDFKEQLELLINEASKKGIYVYDMDEDKLSEVELKRGIEISAEFDCIRSYDEEDVAFLRQRIKKED